MRPDKKFSLCKKKKAEEQEPEEVLKDEFITDEMDYKVIATLVNMRPPLLR